MTFTYDDSGVPTSVQVGANPQTAPRYYYVYNGHGDVVNLADANGNLVASYTYDEFGVPLSSSESFPGGWSNPYRYDGRDLVRYDGETSLYWMSVRAYDPTLGRFLSRDPLGRTPLMGWSSQPYAYAGNNPLVNVDPSGQRLVGADGAVTETAGHRQAAARNYSRIQAIQPRKPAGSHPQAQAHHSTTPSGGWADVVGGIAGLTVTFGPILMACFTPLVDITCPAWVKALGGFALNSAHALAQGLGDVLGVQSADPLVRMAYYTGMMWLAAAAVLVNLTNLWGALRELKAAWDGLAGGLSFLEAFISGGPKGAIADAVFTAKDSILELVGLKDFNADANQWVSAANAFLAGFNPADLHNTSDCVHGVCPEPAPTPGVPSH